MVLLLNLPSTKFCRVRVFLKKKTKTQTKTKQFKSAFIFTKEVETLPPEEEEHLKFICENIEVCLSTASVTSSKVFIC